MFQESQVARRDRFGTVREILVSHPVRKLALVFLCAPYLASGIQMLANPGAAADAMVAAELVPGAPYVAASTMFQLGCSMLILTGFLRWIGALALAVFTFLGSLSALASTGASDDLAMDVLRGAYTDMGLVGGLLLVSWYALHKHRNGGVDDWK